MAKVLRLPSHADIHEFEVLWTNNKTQKRKEWHDGYLKWHTFNYRSLLYDQQRKQIGSEFFPNKTISSGINLEFSSALVEVGDQLESLQANLEHVYRGALAPSDSHPSRHAPNTRDDHLEHQSPKTPSTGHSASGLVTKRNTVPRSIQKRIYPETRLESSSRRLRQTNTDIAPSVASESCSTPSKATGRRAIGIGRQTPNVERKSESARLANLSKSSNLILPLNGPQDANSPAKQDMAQHGSPSNAFPTKRKRLSKSPRRKLLCAISKQSTTPESHAAAKEANVQEPSISESLPPQNKPSDPSSHKSNLLDCEPIGHPKQLLSLIEVEPKRSYTMGADEQPMSWDAYRGPRIPFPNEDVIFDAAANEWITDLSMDTTSDSSKRNDTRCERLQPVPTKKSRSSHEGANRRLKSPTRPPLSIQHKPPQALQQKKSLENVYKGDKKSTMDSQVEAYSDSNNVDRCIELSRDSRENKENFRISQTVNLWSEHQYQHDVASRVLPSEDACDCDGFLTTLPKKRKARTKHIQESAKVYSKVDCLLEALQTAEQVESTSENFYQDHHADKDFNTKTISPLFLPDQSFHSSQESVTAPAEMVVQHFAIKTAREIAKSSSINKLRPIRQLRSRQFTSTSLGSTRSPVSSEQSTTSDSMDKRGSVADREVPRKLSLCFARGKSSRPLLSQAKKENIVSQNQSEKVQGIVDLGVANNSASGETLTITTTDLKQTQNSLLQSSFPPTPSDIATCELDAMLDVQDVAPESTYSVKVATEHEEHLESRNIVRQERNAKDAEPRKKKMQEHSRSLIARDSEAPPESNAAPRLATQISSRAPDFMSATSFHSGSILKLDLPIPALGISAREIEALDLSTQLSGL